MVSMIKRLHRWRLLFHRYTHRTHHTIGMDGEWTACGTCTGFSIKEGAHGQTSHYPPRHWWSVKGRRKYLSQDMREYVAKMFDIPVEFVDRCRNVSCKTCYPPAYREKDLAIDWNMEPPPA